VDVIEVFADVSCPFAHVGLRRFVAERRRRGRSGPILQVRPWPLELVNRTPLTGPSIAPKVAALQASVAPGLFRGFDPERFPRTTLPVLAAEAAASAKDAEVGERFSLTVRSLLFEEGIDPSNPQVLARELEVHGISRSTVDQDAVLSSWSEGKIRGVLGSPHFFLGDRSWFCPSLDIRHDDEGYDIRFDTAGLDAFLDAAFS
jgi:predicted DsbA family dithiol-disulfide isomerase